eukprot:1160321-Pelagomonas_calceolata.AAC.5
MLERGLEGLRVGGMVGRWEMRKGSSNARYVGLECWVGQGREPRVQLGALLVLWVVPWCNMGGPSKAHDPTRLKQANGWQIQTTYPVRGFEFALHLTAQSATLPCSQVIWVQELACPGCKWFGWVQTWLAVLSKHFQGAHLSDRNATRHGTNAVML